ncbi:MAG: L-aspartate oxidase [Streptosporangiaceae bacterium]
MAGTRKRPRSEGGGIVARLLAPDPSWSRAVEVVVAGSGVAGLTVALQSHRAGLRVLVVTKAGLADGSTRWAQGGVAAALSSGDSPERHLHDTLVAGAGICDETAARTVVDEAPRVVRELVGLGAVFDADGDGGLAFTREGGHSIPRVLHAGGDATGREIQRTLETAVRADAGAAAGVKCAVLDRQGRPASVGTVRARAVVLATGGAGQLYAVTSNPEVATGDGLALALRAGAEVTDLEFVQFHPTVLFAGPGASGRQLLVSEAVRGEGAVLVDATGTRIMAGAHPAEDLAPRDVVALAIARRMRAAPGGVGDHVYLDARRLGERTLRRRFPTILAECRTRGIDPAKAPIPVAPAAHYFCGGVRTDLAGRTSIPGLYAVGEIACTGLHGANRLASNSLLEGLVMGARVAAVLASGLPQDVRPAPAAAVGVALASELRGELATTMARHVGVLRDPSGLETASTVLDRNAKSVGAPGAAAWAATNLYTVARALVAAALAREESRGCHNRRDYPAQSRSWLRHIVVRAEADGGIRLRTEAMEGAAA